eukprot:gene2695-3271_t
MSPESSPNIRNPKASIILLGESDNTEVPISSLQIPRMRIVRRNTITEDLMDLLAMEDPTVTAYNDGRDVVLDVLSGIVDPLDYLCSAPLEAMYFWAFATSSTLHGKLKFSTSSFIIRCQHLLPGRLFTNDKLGLYDITKLNPNVIYFADGRGQMKRSHPLADLFFVSEGDELVLIDITAGDSADVLRKSKRMAAWMRHFDQGNANMWRGRKLVARGVIIAPAVSSRPKPSGKSRVVAVCGAYARKLLYGLSQVYEWLL